MDSDRGEDNNETDQSSRRKAKEILGNRHKEVQMSCSVHIGYFIQNIDTAKEPVKSCRNTFQSCTHKRTKCRAFPCLADQQQGGPDEYLQNCHNIAPFVETEYSIIVLQRLL